MIDLSVLLRRISDLAALIAGKPDLHGAVVTGADPLEIRLDAAPSPLQGKPDTLVSGLQVDDRVLVAMQTHRALVLGRRTGYPSASRAEVVAGIEDKKFITPAVMHGIHKVSTKTSGNQTATTSEVTISGVTVTLTVAAATQVRFAARFHGYSSVAGDAITIRVKDGGTTVALWTVTANSASAATSATHSLDCVSELAAGAHTLTMTFVRAVGTGTITSAPTAFSPAQLEVEEIIPT